MRILAKALQISTLILPAVVFVGCGAGSSNLADPTKSTTTTSTDCTDSTCTTGQFIDDPVAGLNYTCDTVTSRTDTAGFFKCPKGSTVQFYLKATNGQRKIVLGSYKLTTYSSALSDSVRRITVLDLVSGASDLKDIGTDSVGTQIRNMLRFFHALDVDGDIANAPSSNRIALSEEDKEAIDKIFASDISASIFAANSFDAQVKPFFDAIGRSLTTDSTQIQDYVDRLKKAVYVVNSGVFEVAPIGTTLKEGTLGFFGTGVSDSSKKAVEGIVMLQDRDNKPITIGMEWLETLDSSADASVIAVKYSMRNYISSESNTNSPFDLSGNLNSDFKFITTDTNNQQNGSVVMTRGRLAAGALYSSAETYRTVLGLSSSDTVSDSVLGQWERRDIYGNVLYRGTANMSKIRRNLDAYLDPAIWKTQATVSSGEKFIFPLHFKISFLDSRLESPCTSGCYVGANDGTTNGKIGMTILENGNIVSDIDNDCNPVDPVTLKDSDNTQEYRIGVVGTAVIDSSIPYITPIVLIPKIPGWEAYYSLNFGLSTSLGGYVARINLSNLGNNKLSISTVSTSSTSSSDSSSSVVLHTVSWTKYRDLYDSLRTLSTDTQYYAASYGTFGSIELQDQTKDACKIKTKS